MERDLGQGWASSREEHGESLRGDTFPRERETEGREGRMEVGHADTRKREKMLKPLGVPIASHHREMGITHYRRARI